MQELPELDIRVKIRFIGINKVVTTDEKQIKSKDAITRKPLDLLKKDKNLYYAYKDYYNRFLNRNNKNKIFLIYGVLKEYYFDSNNIRKIRDVEWSLHNTKGISIYKKLQEIYGDNIVKASIVVKDVIDVTDKYHPDDIKQYIDNAYDATMDEQLDQYLSTIPNADLRKLLNYIINKQKDIVKAAISEYENLNKKEEDDDDEM